MRILFFSDLHLDAVTAGVPRWDDLTGALDQIYAAAKIEQVDLVVFAGDWCDPGTKSSRCVGQAVYEAVRYRESGIMSHWLLGNHDTIEDGHGSHVLLPLKMMNCEQIVVHEDPTVELIPAVRSLRRNDDSYTGDVVQFLWLPYTPRSHNYDPEIVIAELAPQMRNDLPQIIVGHLNVEGIGPGSETKDLPRGRDVFWPLDAIEEYLPNAILIGGHYHKPQHWRGVNIIGSVERLTFGEEEDPVKGYMILEIGDDAKEEEKPKRRAPRARRAARSA